MSSTYKFALTKRFLPLLLLFSAGLGPALNGATEEPNPPPFHSPLFEGSLAAFPTASFDALPSELKPLTEAYIEQRFADMPLLCKSLAEARRRNPPRMDLPHFLCAVAYFVLGDAEASLATAQLALKARAAYSDALTLKGYIEARESNNAAAITSLREAAWFNRYRFVSPGYAPYFLATLLAREGESQNTEAVSWYQRALQLQPENYDARIGLAGVFLQQNNQAGALSTLREGARQEGAPWQLKLYLARTLLALRQGPLDDVTNRELVALLGDAAPEEPIATVVRHEWYELSIMRALRQNELEEAEKKLRDARKQFPKSVVWSTFDAQLQVQQRSRLSEAGVTNQTAENKTVKTETGNNESVKSESVQIETTPSAR